MLAFLKLMPLSSKPLAQQADRLSEPWKNIAMDAMSNWPSDLAFPAAQGDLARGLANQISASLALVHGAPGFFLPRIPVPWLQPTGSLESTSYPTLSRAALSSRPIATPA